MIERVRELVESDITTAATVQPSTPDGHLPRPRASRHCSSSRGGHRHDDGWFDEIEAGRIDGERLDECHGSDRADGGGDGDEPARVPPEGVAASREVRGVRGVVASTLRNEDDEPVDIAPTFATATMGNILLGQGSRAKR